MTRRKYSPLWTHFEATSSKKAKCNYCSREIAISKSSIGSLGRHLKTIHPSINIKNVMEDTLSANDSDSDESTLDPDSELWGFFDKARHNMAKCTICEATMKRNSETLYKHLKEAHSKISQNLEFKDKDENYTEVIYLEHPEIEETQTKDKEVTTAQPWQPETRSKLKRRSSAREKPKMADVRDNQGIEDFGRYITSLMKDIPREVSSRLQLEIVNMVMAAKTKSMKDSLEEASDEKCEEIEDPSNLHTYESNTEDPITDQHTFELKKRPHLSKTEKAPNVSTHPEKRLGGREEKQIEDFGQYITSLLKCLKMDTSAQLQMEIVKMVITARLKYLSRYPLVIQGLIELQENMT
ncbi:unnamed protein product [Leptosia nina]|uniref:BED-type domain-containing protein n=1 Tax=Leptosia nina TaxID=320188 RepID=A0AAV1K390_9NEOP